ncbi:MAG: LL-diaminopimelate aminotransferase [Spirochaetales bacterium]|nr:LL-diaminopimelate aminotransferase [Spirochaetales bacterium]
MIRINENYRKLKASYLFSEISKRVDEFQAGNPDKQIIRLGIGDVTLPLPEVCLKAFHEAVDEMADEKTFKGYGPNQGYAFLREKIAEWDFRKRGADINADEIFVSDGAKCDSANLQEIFATKKLRIAVPDPVYPVYVDTNVMAGRTGPNVDGRYEGLIYLECTGDNKFIPSTPRKRADLIYLCFPNNPTGATITKRQLKKWVDYAIRHKSLIIFDAAYEAFIRNPKLPHSIYEIPGAREVAIEVRSFSKTAGFTGTRCAYTVVPTTCRAYDSEKNEVNLHSLWGRRQNTKFNGVSYPVQKAASAIYSELGQKQVKTMNDYYLRNATLILKEMTGLGFQCTGGTNAPYIWVNGNTDSWEFFNLLLKKAGVVVTPGAGFGKCGEGYIRISAFNNYESVQLAMKKIVDALRMD